MMRDDDDVGRWRVLSCYTANLAAYLAADEPADEVGDHIARSVWLAVRPESDGQAISHHATPLHHLPDGRRLAYRGCADRDQAVEGLRAEFDRSGRLLVLAHSTRLPWSVSATDAPHLVLLTDFDPRADRWRAVDHFAGLLPSGAEQPPYAGDLDGATLLDAMAGGKSFTAEQERRNRMFFGAPVSMPAAQWRWLAGTDDRAESAEPAELSDDWLTEPDRVWPVLRADLAEQLTRPGPAGLLDDLWAAAQHHRYRNERLLRSSSEDVPVPRELLARADAAWAKLPQTLRFAAEAAERGRPRTRLIGRAIDQLADAEAALRAPLLRSGWARSPIPATAIAR